MSSLPLEIKGIDHVVLRVRDLSRSIEFYERVLGCAVERQVEKLGLIQLRAGASLIDLVGVDTPLGRAGGGAPSPDGPNVDHFAVGLMSFDFAQIRDHLETHGVSVGEPETRVGAEGSGPSVYIQDPDGNTIELKGPPD